MLVGIDFGITNTDIVVVDNNNKEFFSLLSEKVDRYFLNKIFDLIKIDFSKVKKIAVTGGKSDNLDDTFCNIPIIKINEVQSIGYGAREMYSIDEESFVVVSAGTGTACIGFMNNEFHYLGGIAIGGGTLQGLSNLIIETNDAKVIDSLALEGDRSNLDYQIGEVVNDIGSLYPEITASNFSKARNSSNQSSEDLAAALTNMIGESIGTIAYLNSLLVGVQKVYFLGRVSLLNSVKKGIDDRLKLADIKGEYIDTREFGNAIGAIAYLKTNP